MTNSEMADSLTKLENTWKAKHEFNEFIKRVRNNEVRNNGTEPIFSCIDRYLSDSNNNNTILTLKEKTVLYRARLISINEVTYDDKQKVLLGFDESGSREPPLGISTSGRNNIAGVSYLYLSDNKQTACSEVKPMIKELVSLAEFEVIKPLKIVNFESKQTINNPDNEIKSGILFSNIMQCYTVPVLNDADDYKITQVLSDYIRKKGYDGICYKSFYDLNGKNYTIFNSDRSNIKFINSSLLQFQESSQKYYDFNEEKSYCSESLGGHVSKEDNIIIKKNIIAYIRTRSLG